MLDEADEEKREKLTGHLSPLDKATLPRLIAARYAKGETISQMARDFKLSRKTIKRIIDKPETQDLVKQIVDSAVVTAKNMIRVQSEKLAPKALKAMEELLDSESGKDKAEGVKLFFRSVGLDKIEEAAGTGTLIVQLPGAAKEEKAIEIPGYEVNDDSDDAS